MKKIKAKGNLETASFDFKLKLTCEECGSKKLNFQLEENNITGDVDIDSPYAENKYTVLGVDCENCGYGYSLNLSLR